MKRTCLDGYFQVMLSNEDVSKPKPDPEIYLTAFSTLGVDPRQALVVEDNENGIRAARASGAHVLEVRNVDEVNLDNILARILLAERETMQ